MTAPLNIKKAPQISEPANQLARVWDDLNLLADEKSSGIVAYHFTHALKAIGYAPFTFIASVLTGAVAYLLITLGGVVIENVDQAITEQSSDLIVTLYLKDGVSDVKVKELIGNFESDSKVAKAAYVPKSEAMKRLSRMLGDNSILLSGLEDGVPLPASIEVKFKDGEIDNDDFGSYVTSYLKSPEVEQVEYNKNWLGYINKVSDFIKSWGVAAIFVLILISSLVVFNTTRLGLYAHRKEVEIMKLLGARDSFVRAPYVIEGALQGFLSGVVGIGVAYLIFVLLAPFLEGSSLVHALFSGVEFVSDQNCYLIMGLATIIGALSAWLGAFQVKND